MGRLWPTTKRKFRTVKPHIGRQHLRTGQERMSQHIQHMSQSRIIYSPIHLTSLPSSENWIPCAYRRYLRNSLSASKQARLSLRKAKSLRWSNGSCRLSSHSLLHTASSDPLSHSKHGTYRPNLANLVASNSEDAIRSTTKSAFATYEADNDSYNDSLKTLTKLKGIGPATASLLLSCHDPLKVPFFSDQLFRYSLWIRTHGQGWDRKIKYSISEYVEMFGKVEALRERLGKESGETVSALDLEKVAYVLAKEAKPGSKRYDVEGDGGDEEKDPQLEGPTKKRKGTASKVEVAKKGPTQQPNTKRRRKGPADVADED